MTLYHCRPIAFATALTYLATSSSLVFTGRVSVRACVCGELRCELHQRC
jgi:hypothetical protein